MDIQKFLIGADWRISNCIAEVRDPYTNEQIANIYNAQADDVDAAIIAAQSAVKSISMLHAYERAEILKRVAMQLAQQRDEIAQSITAQIGKPIRFAQAEVDRAVCTFTIAAEEATRLQGERIPLDAARGGENAFGITQAFPIGVIAAISPFNFPLNLAAHKIAPAFAVGNATILKPSPQAPLTGLLLGKMFLEAGAPPGALNVLPCANETAQMLVEDNRIAAMSFTGSANVGWRLKSIAGKKRVLLELGGNAAVVAEDADDITAAARAIAASAFAYAGQICISAQRIYVKKPLYNSFVEQFILETKKLSCGNPVDPETIVGPMIDAAAMNRILQWIDEAKTAGAEVLYDGGRERNVLAPTILTNVPANTTLCREEAFAPVAIIESYNTFDDALNSVNESRYGLQASIYTRNLEKAFRAFREIRAGAVLINTPPSFRMDSMPYGGVKDSGVGREGVRFAIREMAEERLMIIRQ